MSDSESTNYRGTSEDRDDGVTKDKETTSVEDDVPTVIDRGEIARILKKYKLEEFARELFGDDRGPEYAQAPDGDEGDAAAFQELVEEVAQALDFARVAPPRLTEKQAQERIRRAAAHSHKAAAALDGFFPRYAARFQLMADSLEDELEPDLAAIATRHLPSQGRRNKPNQQRNPVYESAVDQLYPLLRERIEEDGGRAMLRDLLFTIPGKHEDSMTVADQLRKTLLPRARAAYELEESWAKDDYRAVKAHRSAKVADGQGGKKR